MSKTVLVPITALEIDPTCSVMRDSFLSVTDEAYYPPTLLSSYFGNIIMAKVCISSDIIKPFSGEGDVVA